MTIPTLITLLTTLGSCGGGDREQAGHPDGETDRQAIVQQLAAARQRLGVMRLQYRFPLPAHESRGGYMRHTYWFDHDHGLAFDSSHGERGIDSDDWTERQKTIIVEDGWLATWPNKRSYAWSHEEEPAVPTDIRHSPVFQAIGLWPLRGRYPCAEIEGSVFDLETIVADPRYRIRRIADGDIVLERPNADRCRLDHERGFALLERVWFDPEGNESMRITVPSLRDMGNGVWLPAEFHLDTSSRAAGVGTTRRLTGQLEAADDSGRSGLAFSPPPGAMLLNHRTSALTQVIPGGEGYLTDRADWMRAFYRARQSGAATVVLSNPWFWGALAFVACWVAGRKLYREKLS
ncbi:MAG: hypothetical protein NXI31_17825 [bacterium]|nr:hypothetical protein [bacterium]